MSKVNELQESITDNKSAKYFELVKGFGKKANEIMNNSESFFARKSAEEVMVYFRKCEQADCEYTSYVNAHAAEVWLEKAISYDINKQ